MTLHDVQLLNERQLQAVRKMQRVTPAARRDVHFTLANLAYRYSSAVQCLRRNTEQVDDTILSGVPGSPDRAVDAGKLRTSVDELT